MTEIAEKLVNARFLRESKNRFLCEVEIDGSLVECYVPSSCRLDNFLELEGKTVLLRRNASPSVRTQYALVAVPYKHSYLLLNSSFANDIIEEGIRGRRFCFLGKRTKIYKEYHIEGYKADLFIMNSNTIVEIKSVISTSKTAVFPTVHSERAIKQLNAIKKLLQMGYKACYIIVSLNPYVNEIALDTNSALFERFAECRALGMTARGLACRLKENKISICKTISLIEEAGKLRAKT